jgi:hypothetical protein
MARIPHILILAFIGAAAFAQPNPPFIPSWPGSDPIRYVIDATADPYRPEIVAALRAWGQELPSGVFLEVKDPAWHRTIVFRVSAFGAGNAFLAMSMYPPPLIAEPWAGDVTINSDAGWQRAEMRPLLLPLLLHEIGHSLGMGHSWFTDSVMFPNISPANVRLSATDRRLIRCLYRNVCE